MGRQHRTRQDGTGQDKMIRGRAGQDVKSDHWVTECRTRSGKLHAASDENILVRLRWARTPAHDPVI